MSWVFIYFIHGVQVIDVLKLVKENNWFPEGIWWLGGILVEWKHLSLSSMAILHVYDIGITIDIMCCYFLSHNNIVVIALQCRLSPIQRW